MMMRGMRVLWGAVFLAGTTGVVLAASVNSIDAGRLTQQLDALAADPTLGQYATAERDLARHAVDELRQAKAAQRDHALYMAKHRVELARLTAELGDQQHQLAQARSEHDRLVLEATQRDATAAQQELARERLQSQLTAEHNDRLQAEGEAYSTAAKRAQAAAAQAQRAAQAKAQAASAAEKEAKAAEDAVRLMRQQLEELQKQGAAPAP